jgi:hypothetical protein
MNSIFILLVFCLNNTYAFSLGRFLYKGTIAENVERALPTNNDSGVKKTQPYKNDNKIVYAQVQIQIRDEPKI